MRFAGGAVGGRRVGQPKQCQRQVILTGEQVSEPAWVVNGPEHFEGSGEVEIEVTRVVTVTIQGGQVVATSDGIELSASDEAYALERFQELEAE